MYVKKTAVALLAGVVVSSGPAAFADITRVVSVPGLEEPHVADPRTGDSSGGYGDRTPGQRGVRTGDSASVSLNVTTLDGGNAYVNGKGDFAIMRGPTFTDIGQHLFGLGTVQGQWDEVVNSGRTFVNLVIKTSDQGALIPAGANVDGSAVALWNWRFGLSDAIEYEPNVTSVILRSATAFYSRNNGRSFFSSQIFTASLPQNFVPGRDPGISLVTVGDGTNYVLLRYEIDVTVPTPGTLVILAGSLLGMRRRR